MPLSLFTPIDDWLVPPPEAKKVEWIAKFTFAHRGQHGAGVPENSPSAFASAIGQGLGIECDIQRTGDGRAVVFHDWELDRLTEASGPVAEKSAERLARITLSGSSDRIATLRQLLDLVAGRVPLLIEVKSRRDLLFAGLCAAIHADLKDYSGRYAVMSFDPRVSRWFADNSPTTVRGLVVTEEGGKGIAGSLRRRLSFWHARPEFLAYDIRDLPGPFPSEQRQRGIPVATWTVRTPELNERAHAHADAPIAEGAGLEMTS
jgi:glycerophosphoryl diester phosphodiesterase